MAAHHTRALPMQIARPAGVFSSRSASPSTWHPPAVEEFEANGFEQLRQELFRVGVEFGDQVGDHRHAAEPQEFGTGLRAERRHRMKPPEPRVDAPPAVVVLERPPDEQRRVGLDERFESLQPLRCGDARRATEELLSNANFHGVVLSENAKTAEPENRADGEQHESDSGYQGEVLVAALAAAGIAVEQRPHDVGPPSWV